MTNIPRDLGTRDTEFQSPKIKFWAWNWALPTAVVRFSILFSRSQFLLSLVAPEFELGLGLVFAVVL